MSRWAMLLAGVAATVLWGCPPNKPPVEQNPLAGTPAEGKALYDKYCKVCHGDEGVGYSADNANALANQDFLKSATDSFIYTAIQRGRPDTAMAAYASAFGGPLESSEIRLLMTYLRSFQVEEDADVHALAVSGDATAGAPVFAEHCAKCHGAKGEGTEAISLSNPLFLASASDGFIRHAIANGRRGTPMLGYQGDLSASDIDNLTRLIRSWARNVDNTPATGEVPPSFDQVVVNPDGPSPEFPKLKEGRFVSADDVKAQLDKGARMIFVDARATSDWLKSHIPGALPLPYYDTGEMIDSLPNDGTWIISYCACPHALSGKVMDMLRERGFKNTAVLDEGILVWTARGYPLTFGATP